MAKKELPKPGTIAWVDLTVPHAAKVRDFYAAVTGWKPEAVSMGSYQDYNMTKPGRGGRWQGSAMRAAATPIFRRSGSCILS